MPKYKSVELIIAGPLPQTPKPKPKPKSEKKSFKNAIKEMCNYNLQYYFFVKIQ